MKQIFLFPGQGSQYVGMGKSLENHSSASLLLESASDILHYDFKKIILEGPIEKLKQTQYTQPALFVVSMMTLSVLQEKEIVFDYVAGHSLGEYSALCASGVVRFEDCLKLVQLRGELMATAGEDNPGCMTAILGLTAKEIETAVAQAKDKGNIVVANYNSLTQIIISGETKAIKKAESLLEKAGAKKIVRLPVSGAFHSPLMGGISSELQKGLDTINFTDAIVPVISNVTAQPVTNSQEIKSLLLQQIVSPVKWVESVNTMEKLGITQGVEVGAGKVLMGLFRGITKGIKVTPVESPEQVEQLLSTNE